MPMRIFLILVLTLSQATTLRLALNGSGDSGVSHIRGAAHAEVVECCPLCGVSDDMPDCDCGCSVSDDTIPPAPSGMLAVLVGVERYAPTEHEITAIVFSVLTSSMNADDRPFGESSGLMGDGVHEFLAQTGHWII